MSLRALEAYEDGRLSAAGRARVEAKLARDPALRRLRAALRAYRAVIVELPAPRALVHGLEESTLDESLATRIAADRALDRALSDARDVEATLARLQRRETLTRFCRALWPRRRRAR